MAGKQKQTIRQRLRSISARSSFQALKTLGDIRAELRPDAYRRLRDELKVCAPAHKGLLGAFAPTPRSLAYNGPITPVTLANEMKWSLVIFEGNVHRLNAYLSLKLSAQESLAAQDWSKVLAIADEVLRQTGWSFWALDLKTAALQACHGLSDAKAFLQGVRAESTDMPLALYSTILLDRIDDTFSFSSFRAKISRSSDNFKPKWFRDFVVYKATGELPSPEDAFPVVLSVDFGSSLVDYYETAIDCLLTVVSTKGLAHDSDDALALASGLNLVGVMDPRLSIAKQFAQSGDLTLLVREGASFSPVLPAAFYRNLSPTKFLTHELADGSFREASPMGDGENGSFYAQIPRVGAEGLNGDDFDALVKFGINFKSLPLGLAIALRAMMTLNIDDGDPLFDLNIALGVEAPGIERMLCYRDEVIVEWLRQHPSSDLYSEHESQALSWMQAALDGEVPEGNPPLSLFALWATRHLVNSGRYREALVMCDKLEEFGDDWKIYASKIRTRAFVENGDLLQAVESCAKLLIEDYRLAYDLPLKRIFNSSKWSDFSGVSRYALGVASHYANVTEPSGSPRFICRMCCRELFKLQDRARLDASWQVLSDSDQRMAIAFYEDVWTEDNLALVDDLKSTHDVRRERISVFQSLLSWNKDEESEYSEYIRQLTLDETLWLGLKYLDQNRLFVNDSAISRWAEKELFQPYERCRRMALDGGGADLNEELVRTYLINPSIENLVNALPATAATEVNAALLEIVQGLQVRFLADPADGLESYLSLRIRHGTLRGTILGPLEQAGLLITGAFSESAFENRWATLIGDVHRLDAVIAEFRIFSREIGETVKRLIDDRVQINSKLKPLGAFKSYLDDNSVRGLVATFSAETSFADFLYVCYQLFWVALQRPRAELAHYISVTFKDELQKSFDSLIERLDQMCVPGIVPAVRASGTQTQQQCDIVARWFTNKSDQADQSYRLDVAIDIAGKATKSIYRGFPESLELEHSGDEGISLTSKGLAVLYDCLFVAFENAWKHSGLGEELEPLGVKLSFDTGASVLNVAVSSGLSPARLEQLDPIAIDELRAGFMGQVPGDAVAREGGSGFAKLAKAVRMARTAGYADPLTVDVEDGIWTVKFSIPLYDRGGAYDAFI